MDAVWSAWTLRPPAALGHPGALSVALAVAALAGVSTEMGQLAIFATNRVRGWRLLLGMSIGALANVALRAMLAALIALLAFIATGRADVGSLALVYLFSTAPHLLGFLAAIPYFGLGLSRLLEGWTLLALAAILGHLIGRPWVALAIAASVWALGQLLSRVLARPASALASVVWTRLTGSPTVVTANDILTGAPMIPRRPSAELARGAA